MFGEDPYGSIVQRGIDEALACQDMLARTPIKSPWVSRMVASIGAALQSIAHRRINPERPTTTATSHGTQ
jgi:hypothetical protein